VGWPPIRSYRKNSFQPKKAEDEAAAGMYVKFSFSLFFFGSGSFVFSRSIHPLISYDVLQYLFI
jgi:hypothetical protein